MAKYQKIVKLAFLVIRREEQYFSLRNIFQSLHAARCVLKTEKVTRFISSIYLDQEIDCITPELVKICNFFRDNNVNAIIGMDSNSWSPFWGSKSSNPRGIELETFCIQNNLVVLNKGSVPTFKTIRAKSVIDITLAYGKYSHIHNWHVMQNHYFFSDHQGIKFQMTVGEIPCPTVDVTNWVNFKEALTVNELFYPVWTAKSIETESMLLQHAIFDALEKSTHKETITAKQAKLWNSELFFLRGKVIKLNSKMISNPNNAQFREEFLAAQKEFKKETRNSKQKKNGRNL